jgi:beta-lactamase class D
MKSIFLIQENSKILDQEGDVDARYSPCSTFKIPLSVMGFDCGFLQDEQRPELPFQKGYTDDFDVWKQPHTPELWMKNSCVWYSQCLTSFLGVGRFQNYVAAFEYGNQNLSGDPGKNNGLTRSWLSSSLQISVHEQAEFLDNLVKNHLPASQNAQDLTKKILNTELLVKNTQSWPLCGKTGSGKTLQGERFGWFVGWVSQNNRQVIGVQLVILDSLSAGRYAKDLLKQTLLRFL